MIQRYDSGETLFYCDPPYPHASRGDKNAYGYEMSDMEHIRLATLLRKVKGKVAISGYHLILLIAEHFKRLVNYLELDRVHSAISHRKAWAALLKTV